MNRRRLLLISAIGIALLCLLLTVLLLPLFGKRQEKEPVNEDPQVSEIDYAKISDDNGHYHYEDENFTSSFGIDVSEFQKKIEWHLVADSGVEFAFLRIGWRGATEGHLYDDERFAENYQGARNSGLKVGVYFLSQAISEKEAREEANWLCARLAGKAIDFPIVYDLEEPHIEETPRISVLSRKQFTDNALAFLEEIEKNGYEAMIYTYPYWAENYYEMDRLNAYPLWYASYDEAPDLPVSIWQYSRSGTINGIIEETDLNIMFIPKNDRSE